MSLYRQAFCPICGTTHGTVVTEKLKGYIPWTKENFWERTLTFDPDKPFGCIQETLGRGSFKLVGYFGPEDDPDGYFPLVKARLLAAVREWLNKNWITRAEVEEAIKKAKE